MEAQHPTFHVRNSPFLAGHDPPSHDHSQFGGREPHLQSAGIEEKLQEREDGYNKVQLVARVGLGWVQELPPDQASQEEAVYSHGHHLGRERRWQQKWAGWGPGIRKLPRLGGRGLTLICTVQ